MNSGNASPDASLTGRTPARALFTIALDLDADGAPDVGAINLFGNITVQLNRVID